MVPAEREFELTSLLIWVAKALFAVAALTALVAAYFYVPCFIGRCVGVSGIPLVFAFIFIVACALLGLLIYAVVWLWRGKDSADTQRFLHQRDNDSRAGRLGE